MREEKSWMETFDCWENGKERKEKRMDNRRKEGRETGGMGQGKAGRKEDIKREGRRTGKDDRKKG